VQKLGRVTIDQGHRQAWAVDADTAARMNPANPADAGYTRAVKSLADSGFEVGSVASLFRPETLAGTDVLVIPHAATDDWEKTIGVGSPVLTQQEIDVLEGFVAEGGSLLLLAETEQPKYGNNFAELARRFGVEILNATVQDPVSNFKDVPTWIRAALQPSTDADLAFRVSAASLYRAGALDASRAKNAQVFLRSSETASPANAALGVAVKHGQGRVVILADSDIFGDDSISDLDNAQLWLNLNVWLAGARVAASAQQKRPATWAIGDENWRALAKAIEAIRPMQSKDGSIDGDAHSHADASALLEQILAAVAALAPRFPHQADYFTAVAKDMNAWRDGGFGVPDYFESLELFRPDLHRAHQVEHLVVFSMYTQNGNPNRNLEAVITRTFWPDWLAAKEQTYNNAAFVPIEFVAFTSGYDTNSAVLFPETVSVSKVSTYHWGGIFCDRESARFRAVASAAKELLYLPLPPDAERLVNDQNLAQETFVLWDLIHDRTHSRGDLPFDPFMIKQRMPFWMYALEELRCDLSTFRETLVLEAGGDPLAKYMRYAILFDRLFRFPITGGRVRNYDGLGGQIIFAHLHRAGALNWTDNRLTFDWDKVTDSVVELCTQVEALYHDGINRSRLQQWIAAYRFVSELVQPHPASVWAKGVDHLPTDGELREVVNVILDDEFPLNVFYETLNRKLSDVILATRGITA